MFYLVVFLMTVGLLFVAARGFSTAVKKLDKRACFGAGPPSLPLAHCQLSSPHPRTGCYWGTEKYIKHDFGAKSFPGMPKIQSGRVGFMGPPSAKAQPTYKEVCGGDTEQVEVYDLVFDGSASTYEALVKHFFMFHDPTYDNRQVNDVGTQYASTIFAYDKDQKEIALRVKAELQQLVDAGKVKYFGKTVHTAIEDATVFYPAHEEHQEYLDKNPDGYCNHFYRFKAWPV